MKPIVLFVDDEPNILNGLRRMLRGQREVWDMRFAEGGFAALELTANTAVDAVVSDMRMPSIDGADLLERVGAVAPGVIRIILSGEADRSMTYRTVGQSHRFLSKPCDVPMIVQALASPLTKRARLANRLGNSAAQLDFPSMWAPVEAHENLVSSLLSATPDMTAVADAARADPVLAVRVLQLANSAYFGPARDTACLETAVRHLGVEVLRDLARDGRLCASGVPSNTDHAPAIEPCDVDVARAAQAAARNACDDDVIASLAYLTGLTLQLGRRMHVGSDAPSHSTSIAISAYICCLMGLPDRVCDALERLSAHDDALDLGGTADAIVRALEGDRAGALPPLRPAAPSVGGHTRAVGGLA